MDWKVILSFVILCAVFFAAGCQFLYDLWPADISPVAIRYTGKDPNSIKWFQHNLRTASQIRQEVIDTYIDRQLQLEYQANLNRQRYQQILGFLDMSIQQAQADRAAAIGTADKPGWLLAGLLTLLPVSTFLAGWRTLWPDHYTQQEVEKLLEQAKQK